jgi:hypothetical protein
MAHPVASLRTTGFSFAIRACQKSEGLNRPFCRRIYWITSENPMTNAHKINNDGTATIYIYYIGKTYEVLVDANILPKMRGFNWSFSSDRSVRGTSKTDEYRNLKQVILGEPRWTKIKHRNGNRMDYRKSNLEPYGSSVGPGEQNMPPQTPTLPQEAFNGPTDAEDPSDATWPIPDAQEGNISDRLRPQLAELRRRLGLLVMTLDEFAAVQGWH